MKTQEHQFWREKKQPDSLLAVAWVQLTLNLLLERHLADILDDQFSQTNFANAKILTAPINEIDP